MSLPVSVPYAFANATTTQNLSSLDANFNALANGLNGLANGSSQISVSSISATGTANSTTYLRGDGAWENISTGSTSSISNGTSNVSINTSNGNITSYVNGNLVMTSDSNVNTTFGGTVAMSSSFLRNRVINGDMRIDQRNAGASSTVTSSNYYSCDRWQQIASVSSKYSVQQNAGSVTPPTGFINYLGITSLSAYSVAAGDFFALAQYIEGFNVADLAWGTANAKTVTLSFQVYSSLTGTFGGCIGNNGQTRSYPFTFTISSANTWTSISITIPGDTTGTWLTNNGRGIAVYFNLGSGTTFSGTAGAWAGAQYFSATGATSVVGTNGATFYITGVQLEVGSNATPFERRQYGQELTLCQRYYWKFSGTLGYTGGATTLNAAALKTPVTMRSAPTLDSGAVFDVASGSAGTPAIFGSAAYSILSGDAVGIYNSANNWTAAQVVSLTAGFNSEL